ncbi:MAG: TIGR02099 family protein, partial [Gammaproteobacteria bacterium]|nr:TIGR02099 family protein [Gammaproteobacteria bacterium]
FLVVIVLMALIVGMGRTYLDANPQLKTQMTERISQRLGIPLSSEDISVRWLFSGPELTVESLKFQDNKTNNNILEFESASVILDLQRFLRTGILGVSSVQLNQSEVLIERRQDKSLHVNSLPLQEFLHSFSSPSNNPGTDSTTPKGVFNLKNINLYYRDLLTEQELSLENIDLSIDNNDRLLEVQLSADSEELARSLKLSASTPNPDLHDNLEWRILFEADDLRVAELIKQWQFIRPLFRKDQNATLVPRVNPMRINRGNGNVRVWLQLTDSKLQALNGTVKLNDAVFQRSNTEIQNSLEYFNLRFSYENDEEFMRFKADQLDMASGNGIWPENNNFHIKLAKLTQKPSVNSAINRSIDTLADNVTAKDNSGNSSIVNGENNTEEKSEKRGLDRISTGLRMAEIEATYLNFGDLAPILEVLYLQFPNRNSLPRVNWNRVQGEIKNLQAFAWQAPQDQQNLLSLQTLNIDFNDLAVPEINNGQGISGLNGNFRFADNKGLLELASNALEYTNNKVFSNDLVFDRFATQVNISRNEGSWVIHSDLLEAENADLAVNTDLRIQLAPDQSPVLDLNADLQPKDVDRLVNYFPAEKMSPTLINWIDEGMQGGRIETAKIKFTGALKDYPFRNDQGEFRVDFNVRDLNVQYAAGWPDARLLDADINFLNESMNLNAKRVRSGGMDEFPLKAGFKDLKTQMLDLSIETVVELEQSKAWINASPLKNTLGKKLENINIQGPADSKLVLRLPINDPSKLELQGSLGFSGNTFQLSAFKQGFSNLSGVLNYNKESVFSDELLAEYAGQALNARIINEQDETLVVVNTVAELDTFMSPAYREYISGNSSLDAEIRFVKGQDGIQDIRLRSNLLGTGLSLPAPFAKPQDTILPLNLDIDIKAGAGDARDVMFIRGNIGSTELLTRMQAVSKAPDTPWGLYSIALVGGKNIELFNEIDTNQARIQVLGKFSHVDMDEWFAFINEDRESHADEGLEIGVINVNLDQLEAVGQSFANVNLVLNPQDTAWEAKISNQRVEGEVNFPRPWYDEALITANFSKYYFKLPPKSDEEIELDPREIPNVEVTIEDFKFEDLALGNASFKVQREKNGSKLQSFNITRDSFSVNGSGGWYVTNEGETTLLNADIASTDLAQTLLQFGYAPLAQARQSNVMLELNWPGNPVEDILQTLSGEISFKLLNGELRDVEPGAGRFLALLSIAQLPKRLSLDFRDVFNAGLQYDELSADFLLHNGQAYTNNMLMRGPVADLGVIGRVGLATRDFDQAAVVQADLGSSLPIAGALAGGLGVGAAMLLFSEIFKNPLKQATQVFYKIDGEWNDPKIERTPPSQLKEVPVAPR